ncbi:hypothetical protein ACIQUL_36120 [Streptomyces sp. NPDC090303]|uniref:hypothetical protein n=1 Tax=Streptomyces sp. NPDC090303 TaxID=3365960 RepID=UPI00382F316F
MSSVTELLEQLVVAHGKHEREREEDFRTIPSYDPVPGDQPCSDEDMGDYDDREEVWAFEAESMLRDFVNEVRKCLGMESK